MKLKLIISVWISQKAEFNYSIQFPNGGKMIGVVNEDFISDEHFREYIPAIKAKCIALSKRISVKLLDVFGKENMYPSVVDENTELHCDNAIESFKEMMLRSIIDSDSPVIYSPEFMESLEDYLKHSTTRIITKTIPSKDSEGSLSRCDCGTKITPDNHGVCFDCSLPF